MTSQESPASAAPIASAAPTASAASATSASASAAPSSSKKALLIVLICVCLAGALACAVYLAFLVSQAPGRAADRAAVAALQETQALNSDVVVWLSVPGASIDCAVARSVAGPDFYRSHDVLGAPALGGCAYMSKWNNPGMSDAVTVISADDDTTFAQLRSFSDAAFMKKNPSFAVYSGTRKLTYQVVCAYPAGPDDVLEKYGYFRTFAQLDRFIEDVEAPASGKQAATDSAKNPALTHGTKILVLCTNKTKALAAGHYCVVAVLTEEAEVV